MKQRLIHIIMSLAMTLVVGSCVNSEFEVTDVNQNSTDQDPTDVFLNFSVGIMNHLNEPSTRSDNPGLEGAISKYEKIRTLRVIILHGERTTEVSYLKDSTGYVEHNKLFVLNESGAVRYDDMIFKVRGGEKKRIYFIANEKLVTDLTGVDFDSFKRGVQYNDQEISFENLILKREGEDPLPLINNTDPDKEAYYIPMNEVYDIEGLPMPDAPEKTIDLGKFYITRAAVKFSFFVKFDQTDISAKDLCLKNIHVSSIATSEYFLPHNTIYSEEYESNGLTGRYIESYETPENLKKEKISFDYEILNSPEWTPLSPALYFPESADNTDYSVDITLGLKGTDEEFTFEPKQLEHLHSLPRNTHVVVYLTITDHGIQEAEVTVYPYTAVTLNPEFGFIIPVEKVEISMANHEGTVGTVSEYNCKEGQTFNLIGSVSPYDANNKRIVWESSDETVATVTNYGLVTALKAGETVIKVKSVDNPDKYAECTVTVEPKIPVTGITLSPSSWRGNIAESVRLEATIQPEDATIQDIVWESSNSAVAYVSSYGIVTAVGEGTATITATAADNKNVYATCTINVNPKEPVTGVSITQGDQSLFEGGQFSFNATVSPAKATDKGITWTSSDDKVATVTNYGLVTAVAPGEATITATSTDDKTKTASITVTVKTKIPVTGITISKEGIEETSWETTVIYQEDIFSSPPTGSTHSIRATVTPADATYRGVVWESSDVQVATVKVSSTGSDYSIANVTARGVGEATITARAYDNPKVEKTYLITVSRSPVTGIKLTKGGIVQTKWETTPGNNIEVRATITPADATYRRIIWESSDEQVATVKQTQTGNDNDKCAFSFGNVTAKGRGTATITAYAFDNPDVKVTYQVIVK